MRQVRNIDFEHHIFFPNLTQALKWTTGQPKSQPLQEPPAKLGPAASNKPQSLPAGLEQLDENTARADPD